MKNMLHNSQEICLQSQHLRLGSGPHQLGTENNFTIHRWQSRIRCLWLYTEKEVSMIHRTFGNPLLKALQQLIRRVSRMSTTLKVSKALTKRSDSGKYRKRYICSWKV